MLAGQAPGLAPADGLLNALRDATATVESIPLIASSILSKKIAEGAGALVMDVKVGSGAYLPALSRARTLARRSSASAAGSACASALCCPTWTAVGAAIGNAVEVAEAIEILRGEGPPDVRALTVRLGAEMLVVGAQGARPARRDARIERAIDSGAGLERFALGVRLQGGDPRVVDDPTRLPRARRSRVLRATRAGVVVRADAGLLGARRDAARGRPPAQGGPDRPRRRDHVAGQVGTPVARGDVLCTLHYDDAARAALAEPLVRRAFQVGPRALRPTPLVLETLG